MTNSAGRAPPSPPPPAIQVAGLGKDYGDRRVLYGLDLRLEWGEIAALFGANGAGKTTLLRILAGLARPDAGRIVIAGRPLSRRNDAARRLVGFAGHETMLYSDLTGAENLAFYARLYGIRQPTGRIREVLERVGLADRANRRVRTYSHGMRQRMSLARAILHSPSVLLLDEPESGLDAAGVAMLGELLRDWAAGGKSALLTTHNAGVGQAWAQRILTLSGGKIAGDAPADAVPPAVGNPTVGNPAGGDDLRLARP